MLAKPYPVSAQASMPLIPSHLHGIDISAYEVLGAILEARLQPGTSFKSSILLHALYIGFPLSIHIIYCNLQRFCDTLDFKTT